MITMWRSSKPDTGRHAEPPIRGVWLMTDDETLGQRIRRCRRSRGLSLDQAAGLAGISKPYLSRLERGERSVDSRALLMRIATALETSVADLTGQPYVPRDREHADAQRGAVALRLALLDPDGPLPPEPAVASALDDLPSVLTRCDLVEQARVLPDLLVWTQRLATTTGSATHHRGVARAAYAAVFLLRNLGETDLALMTAERMRQAAEAADDPATIALAAYARAHALVPAGAVRRAVIVAQEGFASTSVQDPECLAARGSCLLVAATSTAATGDFDTARAELDDAHEIARQVPQPTVIAGHTSFSAENVQMHRVALEVEAADPVAALDAARPLTNTKLTQRERASYFWVDVGRAYAQLDRHREALDAFRRAERAAPLRVRLSPVVRSAVRTLLDRPYRRAEGARLRGLAERCGVLSHQ